jgi:hypothetical protein
MTHKSNMSSKVLKALTTMALALPAIQCTKGETAITNAQSDFRYTRVNEGSNHYQIDIYQVTLAMALAPNMDISVRANQDVMSGESVYAYERQDLRTVGGSPSTLVAARTYNSIQDKRSVADVTVRYFGDEYHVAIGGGASEENFYESLTAHFQLTNEFNKSNTELSWGYSVSNDSIRPSLSTYSTYLPYQRVQTRQGKLSQRFNVDLKQDLTKTTLAQAGLEFIADRGYLDDPYKIVFVNGNPMRSDPDGAGQTGPLDAFGSHFVRDRRPDCKGTLAANIKLIQHITPLNASVHLGYRFANNTWDIKSNTFTIYYYQDLGESWQVVPSFRYYTQGEAYFYSMAFDFIGNAPFPSKPINSTGPASSDYRLGKYGSLTAELKVHYKFLADQSAKLTLIAGTINRRNNFYWGRKPYPLNPDNDFKTFYFSLGLSLKF